MNERSGPILAQVYCSESPRTLHCHYLTTVTAEPKPVVHRRGNRGGAGVTPSHGNLLRDVLRATLAFYFANALIRPDVFGLPQPLAQS